MELHRGEAPGADVSYCAALAAFRREARDGWASLPFFQDGSADRIMATLDGMASQGELVLPLAADVFNAFSLTPLDAVKVVIIGQDPYPTPGDAHGLAFSVRPGVAIPRSLGNIYRELASDLGTVRPSHGSLNSWARQGVLLLNNCLTVTAGKAGSHRMLGWHRLAEQAIVAVSRQTRPCVFILWGADAQGRRSMIDTTRHLVVESAHPSPLSARRGFFGSRPFSRANAFLRAKGADAIDWIGA